jgi:hypothetical protein
MKIYKIYCTQNYIYKYKNEYNWRLKFKKGKYYTLERFTDPYIETDYWQYIISYTEEGHRISTNYKTFDKYFAAGIKLRKLKLKKLYESIIESEH